MSLLLASFIFTTNNLATVLGPFSAIPPVGVCCDTHERIDLTRADWQQRERCGWYDCDVSAMPAVTSNEVAVIIGYVLATPPKHGYRAVYEVRRVPDPPGPRGEGVLLSDGTLKTTSGTDVPSSAVGTYDSGTIDQKISEATPQDYETVRSEASTAYSHTSNRSNPHGVSTSQIGAVPTSRTINGHALSGDFSLYASDVGAATPSDVSNAKQEVIEGGVFVTRTLTPDFLRSYRDGECGYGYSYSVSCADGLRRFGATAQKFDLSLSLSSSQGSDDPIIRRFGSYFSGSGQISADYPYVSTPEYADQYSDVPLGACSYYSRNCTVNGLPPFYVQLEYNYYSPYVLSFYYGGIVSGKEGYSLYFSDDGGRTHNCYSFYAEFGTDQYGTPRLRVTYLDDWWDYYSSGVDNRTFDVYVNATPVSGAQEFIVFGSAGKLATSDEVTGMIGSYIQNHDISKRMLAERNGGEYELGTGWGYKLYDWTSDKRSWLIKVPRLAIASASTGNRNSLSSLPAPSDITSWCGSNSQYPSNPMRDVGLAYSADNIRVMGTSGFHDPDCVERANIEVSAWDMPIPGTPGSRGDSAVRIRISNLTYGVQEFASVTEVAEWLTDKTYVCTVSLPVYSYSSSRSNVYTCVCSNFRAVDSAVQYDVNAHVRHYRNGSLSFEGDFQYSPTFGLSVTRSASVVNQFMEVVTPVEKVATVRSSKYFWDPELKCTYEIALTNGCFYGKKVSDRNLTEED